jgi:hypothetical protein
MDKQDRMVMFEPFGARLHIDLRRERDLSVAVSACLPMRMLATAAYEHRARATAGSVGAKPSNGRQPADLCRAGNHRARCVNGAMLFRRGRRSWQALGESRQQISPTAENACFGPRQYWF